MRGNVFLVVVLTSVFLAHASDCLGQELRGQKARLNPDVVTIWHKLGLPQGMARSKLFKDSLINRKGLKPGKERKPKLLRLADPANLEEAKPEMLKVAAKMKMDADLTPQKIKALKYISSVGCSCYNKQTAGLVEKALVEGMKDCSLEVRIAAMCVVISNSGDKCSCQGQCGTCCSEGVVKALQEIAYKMDDTGCYIEPNEQVRKLAERALYLCPALAWKPEPKPEEPPKKEPEPDPTDKGEGDGETPSDDPSDKDETKDIALNGLGKAEPLQPDGEVKPVEGNDPKRITDQETSRRYKSNFRSVSSRQSHGSAWSDPALIELQIRGIVDGIQPDQSSIEVEMVKPYQVPTGAQMVIAIDEQQVSFGTIISSQAGSARISVDDIGLIKNLTNSQRIRLGILE